MASKVINQLISVPGC